jgi:hypothetical protein
VMYTFYYYSPSYNTVAKYMIPSSARCQLCFVLTCVYIFHHYNSLRLRIPLPERSVGTSCLTPNNAPPRHRRELETPRSRWPQWQVLWELSQVLLLRFHCTGCARTDLVDQAVCLDTVAKSISCAPCSTSISSEHPRELG